MDTMVNAFKKTSSTLVPAWILSVDRSAKKGYILHLECAECLHKFDLEMSENLNTSGECPNCQKKFFGCGEGYREHYEKKKN